MTFPNLSTTISSLYVGDVKNHWDGKAPSAIEKHGATEPQILTETGFERDHQADLKVHGGPDKALHHYAADHYVHWQKTLSSQTDKFVPGGVGENISTTGITEKDVCIGDVFSAGSAQIQISQGRQPCWKLNSHIGDNSMVKLFQQSGFTGWYYRVLTTGQIATGDQLTLIKRPNPEWPLDTVIAARFNPALSADVADALSQLPELAQNWRDAFSKKKDRAYKENTTARTKGH
ncbi:MAG: MOSC domain-containing protein [Sneathiella sp.]